MDTFELLKKLSEAPGVSGSESEVSRIVAEEFKKYVDEVRTDALGNVIGLKRGTGPSPRRIMLTAHMDEIGLMVSEIEKGFIRFTTVGGIDERVLPGQEVIVHGLRPLPGVIATKPPHLLSPKERMKVTPRDQLFVDVGLPEEEVNSLVKVGDFISFAARCVKLQGDMASGKAFDDRASVVALIYCLELLSQMRHRWDVYAVATSQEEMGLRGAVVSAYGIAPDLAIVIDVGFGDSPGLSEAETIRVGKGPAIAIGPNFHPLLREALIKTAKELEIPYQIEAIPGPSGTDAWAIQVSREGVPTALLSIPLRYMHTPVETLSLKDIERTGLLLANFISRLEKFPPE
ncbi:MAG: M42 family metallopeptidase [Anaerolineae bacterium]|nr:M42 family metallopeptidase [Anaerolineae bacterium]MDW8102040.1 M42 family metallopeptidase [Anaerolineae bacterium]